MEGKLATQMVELYNYKNLRKENALHMFFFTRNIRNGRKVYRSKILDGYTTLIT